MDWSNWKLSTPLDLNLTTLEGLQDVRALKHIYLRSCESLSELNDISKLTNLMVLDLSCCPVFLHDDHFNLLQGLPALEPVLVEPFYALDFKGRKILNLLHEPPSFDSYRGWQTCKKLGWKEKSLGRYRRGSLQILKERLIGLLEEKSDMEVLWRRIPGLGTKIIGTDGQPEHQ